MQSTALDFDGVLAVLLGWMDHPVQIDVLANGVSLALLAGTLVGATDIAETIGADDEMIVVGLLSCCCVTIHRDRFTEAHLDGDMLGVSMGEEAFVFSLLTNGV